MGRKSRSKQERAPAAAELTTGSRAAADIPILIAVILLTAAVYAQTASHSFLNYDDPQFVTENAQVLQGLKPPAISWAITSASLGWYPLTWMSHMLDVELWGKNSGAHLLVNALLHAITACILFLALRRLTSRRTDSTAAAWASGFVAAMFAIHPMHVESVAWISERKDTLSTLFAAVALLLYAEDPQRVGRVGVAMTLSLLAKQMYVTLPFVLLLLDFWPLGRVTSAGALRRCAIEKWPLFLLTIAGSAAAVIGQQNMRTIQSAAAVPVVTRFANAATAYVFYLGKLIVPVKLAVPYPLLPVHALAAAASALLLLVVTVVVIVLRDRAPHLVTGWFWFVGTLVPVIGIVTIGAQSMADRYSYFPSIGLFLAVAFSAIALTESIGEQGRTLRRFFASAAIAVVLVFTVLAHRQAGYWKNSETLFSHSVAVTGPNPMAEYSLGQVLELTRPQEAVPHLHRSIEILESAWRERGIKPPEWHAQAYVGLATARLAIAQSEPPGAIRSERISRAISELQRALEIDRNAPHAMNNLAVAAAMQQTGAAADHRATGTSQRQ